MSILLLGETILDFDIFLKSKEVSSHTKRSKYIFNKNVTNYGGASNLYKILNIQKKTFFFSNNYKPKNKNYFNISNSTIIKYRYWYKKKNIFQINNISDREKIILEKNYFKILLKKLSESKILVISDHNYGLIKKNIVKKLINYAKLHSIITYYDAQHVKMTSNTYIPQNTDYFLMNRDEFRQYLDYFKIKNYNKINALITLKKKLNTKNIILKQDKDGCICLTASNEFLKIKPIKNKKNIIGAGDKFLAALVVKNNEKNFKKKLIFCNKFAIS